MTFRIIGWPMAGLLFLVSSIAGYIYIGLNGSLISLMIVPLLVLAYCLGRYYKLEDHIIYSYFFTKMMEKIDARDILQIEETRMNDLGRQRSKYYRIYTKHGSVFKLDPIYSNKHHVELGTYITKTYKIGFESYWTKL